MDDKALKALIVDVKTSLLAQVKETELAIKESLRSEIKDTEKSIRHDIDSIRNDVAVHKTEIEILKAKVHKIEESNKAGPTVVVDDAKMKDDQDDDTECEGNEDHISEEEPDHSEVNFFHL